MQKPTDAKGSIRRSVRHCKDMLTHPLQYTISNRLINVKTAPVCLQKTLDDNITLEVIKVMHYADLSILGFLFLTERILVYNYFYMRRVYSFL